VPRELETICLKCLQKEPGQRYASALALAEDLRRLLAGEPILARPIGVWGRVLKWAKRRPAAAALVVLCGAALLGLLLAGVAYNRRLHNEVVREQQHAQEVERQGAEIQTQRALAEANFRAARDAVDQMLTRVLGKSLADNPQAEPMRRQLLGDALRFYQRLLRGRNADREVRRETARAYRRVGDIHLLLGEHAAAAAAAEDLLRTGHDPENDPYHAAALVARCVPLAEKDVRLPPARRRQVACRYADRAVALLRQAIAHGYRDTGRLKKDKDLEALRSSSAFQRLLAELGKSK
jgi:hypothetical protein